MPAIEAVVFDVGGVLVRNPDTANYIYAHLDMPEADFRDIYEDQMVQYATGLISERMFWNAFEAAGSKPVSDDQDLLGDALRTQLDIYDDVLELAGELSDQGIETAVLSNTIHNHVVVLEEAGIYEPFDRDNLFLSHQIGFHKPDAQAYQTVLTGLGVRPDRILVIDDVAEYLASAKELGMKTVLAAGGSYDIATAIRERLFDM